MSFHSKYTLTERKEESIKIITRYPDRIPIICEKYNPNENIPDIDKNKYLILPNINIGQFLYVIRTRIKLSNEKSLFLFINKKIYTNTTLLNDIYNKEKDEDNFLYIYYTTENIFG
jgi:GABA(A) receptor-associated protein